MLKATMGTYLGVALGEKVAPGGLFEAIGEDENERKAALLFGERSINRRKRVSAVAVCVPFLIQKVAPRQVEMVWP